MTDDDVREALGEFIGNVEWAAQASEYGGLDHPAALKELEDLLAVLGFRRIDPDDEALVYRVMLAVQNQREWEHPESPYLDDEAERVARAALKTALS